MLDFSMKVALSTLGCKTNQADSTCIQGALFSNGIEIIPFNEMADVYIINTCTVTGKTDYQARQLIRRALRQASGKAKVIVTGCYAQLHHKEIETLGDVIVFNNTEKDSIINYLIGEHKGDAKKREFCYYSTRSRAYLKVQDGCNYRCSYCIVPMARGRSKSISIEDAVRHAKALYYKGYNEIILTGIHIGSYGQDLLPKSSLIELLTELTNDPAIPRIRISSLEPNEVNDDLISLIETGRVCPHLHIPLQSGDDDILTLMNRRYDTSSYRKVISRIVKRVPNICIGTDVIVGFPGETEESFQRSYRFIEELPFSYIHVFPFSRRHNTAAAAMDGQVRNNTKGLRAMALRTLSINKKNIYKQRQLGRFVNVIIEETDNNSMYLKGISENYLEVNIEQSTEKKGDIITVQIHDLRNGGLSGREIGNCTTIL